MNNIEFRSTTRNFRIPIELDNQILAIQEQLGHRSLTQTWMHLVEWGIWCEDNLKKLDDDPNLSSEIKKEWEQKRKELSSVAGAKHVLENMSDDEVYILRLKFGAEDAKRLIQGEKLKAERKRDENRQKLERHFAEHGATRGPIEMID